MVKPGRGAVALRRARRLWRDVATDARHVGAGTLEALRAQHPFGELRSFCFFVGFPRSGHTLVGSLLDAHPDVVIAHELDAFAFLRLRVPRPLLLSMIVRRDEAFTRAGRSWQGYEYVVPNQWQGRYRSLRVVGDKKGEGTTRRLQRDPRLLDRLRRTVGLPVRAVLVVRNPFDTVATMASRADGDLEAAGRRYLALCKGVARIREELDPTELVEVRHEDVVADPQRELRRLCAFIGVEPDEGYLADCASIVFPAPRRTREQADWPPGLVARLAEGLAAFPFLDGYGFDGP